MRTKLIVCLIIWGTKFINHDPGKNKIRGGKMNSRITLLVTIFLLLLPACSKDEEVTISKRNGIKATSIMTKYEYNDSRNAVFGIPSGAKVYQTRRHEPIGEPVLVASNATLLDEPVGEEKLRVIRVNLSFRNKNGQEIAKMLAFFRPFSDNSYVVKTILDSRYESIYKWAGIPGYSLVAVITTDISSGKKVLETKNLGLIENSHGLFSGLEYHFTGEKVVYISEFVRHLGTGLLVEEQAKQGVLSKDYHTYEFVLSGWPSGR